MVCLGKLYFVTGEAGSGKTFFCTQKIKELAQEEKKITDKLKITQNIDRKKEALKKINNLLEKEIEGEGFKQLKYVRNKSRIQI